MDDSSHFHRPLPRSPAELNKPGDLAEAADIPRPSERVLEEELAAQARRKDRQDFGTLPQNLMEAVLMVQAMEREGKQVHSNREALMNFLKERPGDTVSADLLAAMAMVLEAIPGRRRAREKSAMGCYFRRVWKTLISFIRKVLNVFKTK
jgi:hypothetical protein